MDNASNNPKELTKDILLILYQEETSQARHHEALRAQAATILFAVSASLLTLAGTLMTHEKQSSESGRALLSLGVTLILLGIFGSALSRKQFERSMHSFSRADAYKDCLLALVSDTEVETLFPSSERKARLPLIKKLLDKADDAQKEKEALGGNADKISKLTTRERPWCSLQRAADRDPQKDKGLIPVDLTEEKYLVENLNPLRQEVYVTPLENVKHMWLRQYLAQPRFDLFKLWDYQYLFLISAGLLVTCYGVTAHRSVASDTANTLGTISHSAHATPTPKPRVTPTRRK